MEVLYLEDICQEKARVSQKAYNKEKQLVERKNELL